MESALPKKLTAKQAKFVIEYLVDGNATQSAIRAGYSEETAGSIGSENLSKPEIIKAIDEQMQHRSQRTLITADYVLARIQEVAERCMQGRPVMVYDKTQQKYVQAEELIAQPDGTTKLCQVWEFDSTGANKALENLGKNLRLLTDKLEVGGLDGAPMQFPPMQAVFVKSPHDIPSA